MNKLGTTVYYPPDDEDDTLYFSQHDPNNPQLLQHLDLNDPNNPNNPIMQLHSTHSQSMSVMGVGGVVGIGGQMQQEYSHVAPHAQDGIQIDQSQIITDYSQYQTPNANIIDNPPILSQDGSVSWQTDQTSAHTQYTPVDSQVGGVTQQAYYDPNNYQPQQQVFSEDTTLQHTSTDQSVLSGGEQLYYYAPQQDTGQGADGSAGSDVAVDHTLQQQTVDWQLQQQQLLLQQQQQLQLQLPLSSEVEYPEQPTLVPIATDTSSTNHATEPQVAQTQDAEQPQGTASTAALPYQPPTGEEQQQQFNIQQQMQEQYAQQPLTQEYIQSLQTLQQQILPNNTPDADLTV